MMLRTHAATALSLALILDYWIASSNPHYRDAYIARIIILASAWLYQYLIDNIGHTWKTYGRIRYPARNKWHSLPMLALLASLMGIPASILLRDYRVEILYLAIVVLHWLEDLVTESGVYFYKKRIRLPIRISYNNTWINRLTIVFFALLAVYYVDFFESKFQFIISMLVMLYNVFAFLGD